MANPMPVPGAAAPMAAPAPAAPVAPPVPGAPVDPAAPAEAPAEPTGDVITPEVLLAMQMGTRFSMVEGHEPETGAAGATTTPAAPGAPAGQPPAATPATVPTKTG